MTLLVPDEAWRRIEAALEPMPSALLDLESAVGGVLSTVIRATSPLPPHDAAALDGWAVSGEARTFPPRVRSGELLAGDPPGLRLSAGEAIRIATGAPVPLGTDRIVPVELGSEEAGLLRVEQDLPAGHAIRRRGEVCEAGEVVLPKGLRITPQATGWLASQGLLEVPVHRRPRVALLVTGSELVEPSTEPGPGQLRDSHSLALRAAAKRAGFELDALGLVRDDPGDLRVALERGLEFDVLLTTGGVSAGSHDLVEPLLAELGAETVVDGMAIQPGKPFYAARTSSGGWVFGLPGNPVSALVLFYLFVLPALDRLQGGTRRFWSGSRRARMLAGLPRGKPLEVFVPGVFEEQPIEPTVLPLPLKGSHDLATFARATCLIRRPAGALELSPGEAAEVLPLPGS